MSEALGSLRERLRTLEAQHDMGDGTTAPDALLNELDLTRLKIARRVIDEICDAIASGQPWKRSELWPSLETLYLLGATEDLLPLIRLRQDEELRATAAQLDTTIASIRARSQPFNPSLPPRRCEINWPEKGVVTYDHPLDALEAIARREQEYGVPLPHLRIRFLNGDRPGR